MFGRLWGREGDRGEVWAEWKSRLLHHTGNSRLEKCLKFTLQRGTTLALKQRDGRPQGTNLSLTVTK